MHTDREPPDAGEIARLRELGRTSIESARFTLADVALAETLLGDDGFYDHLDGVHGPLANARGLSVMMAGDGEAIAYGDSKEAATVIVVDLQ